MRKDNSSGKGKIRVLFAEVEGDNETIQEALRAISITAGKAFQSTVVTRQIAPPEQINPKQLEAGGEDEGQIYDVEPEEALEEPIRKQTRSRNTQPKKQPTYSFIGELNLRPVSEKSLRDFFAEKAPQSQQDKVVVVLYYLKKILKIEGVGVNHIYTSLKDVGERIPTDIAQIMRNTANRKGYIKSADCEDYRIETTGENFVEHDLPSKAKSNG